MINVAKLSSENIGKYLAEHFVQKMYFEWLDLCLDVHISPVERSRVEITHYILEVST